MCLNAIGIFVLVTFESFAFTGVDFEFLTMPLFSISSIILFNLNMLFSLDSADLYAFVAIGLPYMDIYFSEFFDLSNPQILLYILANAQW